MIRVVTAGAFALGILLILSAILAFVTGWWALGIVSVVLAIGALMFSFAGMSVIIVSEVEL